MSSAIAALCACDDVRACVRSDDGAAYPLRRAHIDEPQQAGHRAAKLARPCRVEREEHAAARVALRAHQAREERFLAGGAMAHVLPYLGIGRPRVPERREVQARDERDEPYAGVLERGRDGEGEVDIPGVRAVVGRARC
jgi:hypothetical protein